ncbi:hypothetical protein [Actinomadura atramentaria]|uniref:hypothetical protein n=1 Tax=Actinomadura atramentaria TaxID=1990 RepID=UPI00037018F6|nr:hypothetical protein [Actinomadura atramentaria]
MLLVHAVGAGDLGLSARSVEGDPVDPVGADAEPRHRRPLHKTLAGLDKAGIAVDRLLLLATPSSEHAWLGPYTEHAERVAELFRRPAGLFGHRFTGDDVRVARTAAPAAGAALAATAAELAARPPETCLVTSGTGAYAMGFGALLAAPQADVPVSVVPVDRADAPYRPPDLVPRVESLNDWLLRQRHFDELVLADPANADVWGLLAERQRCRTDTLRRALRSPTVPPELGRGARDRLHKPGTAIRAAFFERVVRGEALDQSLLRRWYVLELEKRIEDDAPGLAPRVRARLDELLAALRRPSDETHGMADRIRATAAHLDGVRGRCADLLTDSALTDLVGAAATHRAQLTGAGGLLPKTIQQAADRWQKDEDALVGLAAKRGLPVWPVLGSGDVLVLMCVGLRPDGDPADAGGLDGLERVYDWVLRQSKGLARPPRVRLRLLATEETAERAGSLAARMKSRVSDPAFEAAVIGPLPSAAGSEADAKARVAAALGGADRPRGLVDPASLWGVDEVVLVLNPGKPVTVNAMIFAGIEWSLRTGCRLRAVALGRGDGVVPVDQDGGRVLCRLGPDAPLAALARDALARLDLRRAADVLGHGSPALATVAARVRALHRALYGDPGTAADDPARRLLGAQRLALIAAVLPDRPEAACHLAVEALRPGLFDFPRWKRMLAHPAFADLNAERNRTPYAHLLDRGGSPPTEEKARKRLDAARRALRGTAADGRLVDEYRRLMAALPESG